MALTAIGLSARGQDRMLGTPRGQSDVAGQVIAEFPHLSGNLLHDAHAAILLREHGLGRICTPVDFNHFSFLEVIDTVRL
jgi:hypothetical protein